MAETKGELRKSLLKQVTVLATTAFGLVAALAWNGAIQALFVQIFGTSSSLPAMFSYAIVVTIIAVVVVFYLSKMTAKYTA